MNCASSSTNSAARANRVTTSHSALTTGFLRVMHSRALPIAMTPKNQKKAKGLRAKWLFAFGVRRIPQGGHGMRLRRQPLEVVDETVAGVLRVLVVHPYMDRLFRAHFLAVAAEDAAELVDLVDQRIAVALFILARHELDAVGGTDLGAEPARDAFGPALLVGEHAV